MVVGREMFPPKELLDGFMLAMEPKPGLGRLLPGEVYWLLGEFIELQLGDGEGCNGGKADAAGDFCAAAGCRDGKEPIL